MSVSFDEFGFFNNTWELNQVNWAKMFSPLVSDGVMAGIGEELQVYADSAGMTVHIRPGECRVRGHRGSLETNVNLTVATADSLNPRIDLVVARVTYGNPSSMVLDILTGTVVFAGRDNTGYGNTVIIQHTGGKATLYAHLAMIDHSLGVTKKVQRSQVIGYSGSTGKSTGPHLHFEARTQALNYKTHFNPLDLPLASSSEETVSTDEVPDKLIGADELGETVKVVAQLGAKAFDKDFQRVEYYPQGTAFTFTGNTVQRNGYTYCECKPPVTPVWIAVHDNDAQILK